MTEHVHLAAEMDRINLQKSQMAVLKEIAVSVRAARARWRAGMYDTWGLAGRSSRSLGISVLFVGGSGPRKQIAAKVLAKELSLDLYHIDLSQFMSKYVGETEKNLRRLFDAAEDGGAILFFDEADPLFGQRSEVKDSHDRYTNIGVCPLLDYIEAYRGLTLLAARKIEGIDPSCLSRIRFIVRFPGSDRIIAPKIGKKSHQYRSGDYWLIPARSATGDVEW